MATVVEVAVCLVQQQQQAFPLLALRALALMAASSLQPLACGVLVLLVAAFAMCARTCELAPSSQRCWLSAACSLGSAAPEHLPASSRHERWRSCQRLLASGCSCPVPQAMVVAMLLYRYVLPWGLAFALWVTLTIVFVLV